ncbi:MAG: thioredoxin domain-containing protein [Candidatus Nanohaloarchaea archaeon]|nr:thioredoxin domain-containing protein [Candidatus Nanohaloarchaea archaeon]
MADAVDGEGGGTTIVFRAKHAFILVFVVGFMVGGTGMAVTLLTTGGSSGAVSAAPTDTEPTDTDTQPTQGNQRQDSAVTVSSISFDDDPTIGSPDAPVTIVYWGDFQCPFCKRFEQQTFPRLREDYIKTGKVRFVFKDFAFLGPDSTTAAIASQCVWRQVGQTNPEAYWDWHAQMYDRQDGENRGWGDRQDILAMTRNLTGIDASRVRSCMEENRQQIRQELSEDESQARTVGVSATPGFVIYRSGSETGTKIVGAQPYSRFRTIIERKLDGGTETTGAGGASVDRRITVSGTEYSFSPSTITVEKGQTVKVTFTNTGSIPHNLRIPALGVGSSTIRAGGSDSFTFTAPRSGTFPIRFVCSLPGHSENGMRGRLTLR